MLNNFYNVGKNPQKQVADLFPIGCMYLFSKLGIKFYFSHDIVPIADLVPKLCSVGGVGVWREGVS